MAVGVIGGGSFGLTIATLLAQNDEVYIYSRSASRRKFIEDQDFPSQMSLRNIVSTSDKEQVCSCRLIFPVVPSSAFREMLRNFRDYLSPEHILIHATKGLDVKGIDDEKLLDAVFSKEEVKTMSQLIRDETSVVRIGCLSGPNLAKELMQGLPAASVIASDFNEVIEKGAQALSSNRFFVFGSYDIKGTEMAGAYKNIIALGTGMLAGLDYGKNLEAILINRGLHEMITFGQKMGASSKAFLGTAGIGDLVATATSRNSRNYNFGIQLAQGAHLESAIKETDEIIEGVRTLKIIRQLAKNEQIILPITEMIYKIVFENLDIPKAIRFLMSHSYAEDVEFI